MYPDRDTLEQLNPARTTLPALQHAGSKNGGKWRDRRRGKTLPVFTFKS